MHNDEFLIEKTKKLFESRTGWGDSDDWTNQDFVILSEKIQERTGVMLSHVTLKRVWGKVKYESLPNTHTLDTLVQFLEYENWRDFKSQNGNGKATVEAAKQIVTNGHAQPVQPEIKKRKFPLKTIISIIAVVVVAIAIVLIVTHKSKPKIIDSDYTFSSKTIVSEGLPNSVVFNYDATKSPYDSVMIQQSWDKTRQVKVSKNQHQHTSVYYYPDYFKAKLIVGGKIVSMHRLLIKTKGWLPFVARTPVPVYFDPKDAIANGKMSLSIDKLKARNINMQPEPPTVLYTNVGNFGEIYSGDFSFETSVRNDYREGASACQITKIYILCEGTAIYIPLSAKGCISTLDMLFTNFYTSGKQEDLSGFGVDFNNFVKVNIVSKGGKANIFLNDKLVYTVKHDIVNYKIIGFYFSFQGTGTVDYLKLSNGKVNYVENF
ncbi:MAG TPA: hypothetical protein VGN20_07905 [Mucilaginibacter sp.]|jgi:hypothetical protein